MTRLKTAWIAALVVHLSGGTSVAHHSLANHDVTKAVRFRGTVVEIHKINPHSIIYMDEKDADGRLIRRWAVEGPAGGQLARRGWENVVKIGDVLEVCGYMLKEPVVWQIARENTSAPSLAGRLITAELFVMPDGREQDWGGYGIRKCYADSKK